MSIGHCARMKNKYLKIICLPILAISLAFGFFRIFVCDRFIVTGDSMEPTFSSGEKIYVNKLCFGPRIYTSFRFEEHKLSCFRLSGIRRIQSGDIIVFNCPYSPVREGLSFVINYVFTKRCVGCPGDTLFIRDSHICSSSRQDASIPTSSIERLHSLPDSILIHDGNLWAGQFADKQNIWTIKDFGPYIIPRKGQTIILNENTKSIYKDIIEYESCHQIQTGIAYTFQQNYYFVIGDNVGDSYDSRYYGPIPEDYIIGIVAGHHNNHIKNRDK